MNTLHRHIIVGLVTISVATIIILSAIFLMPFAFMRPQKKPSETPQPLYDYYIILDKDTGRDLMYVPLLVHTGDEVITEENKRYRVLWISADKAYAEFVENIKLNN